MDIQKIFEQLYIKNAPNWSVEREPNGSYKYHATQSAFVLFEKQQCEIDALKAELNNHLATVTEVSNRKGGYYIQDLRNPIGNCMKFWYSSGYGTKHKNFFWCETYEEAQKYAGGCDWFKIWYAPYIDSLIEYTIDMQLADRDVEKFAIETQEQNLREATPNGE